MKLSAAGLDRIKRYEACSLTVYDDQAGLPTIGWGHLIKAGEPFDSTSRLTQEQADALLLADLAPVEKAVNEVLRVDVTQEQYDSIVSFTFNCGVGALCSSTFLRFINMRADHAAIRDALGRWNKITTPRGKEPSEGLTKRRADEGKAWP